jgi:hypothetical protein
LHLGDAGAIGLSDARLMAAEAMLSVARGGDPAGERQAERGAGTFAELAQRYLVEHAKKRNKSCQPLPSPAMGLAQGGVDHAL